MSPFYVENQSLGGRRGRIETPHGTVQTPAIYPVLNFIAGTTTESGGIWKYTRERLLKESSVPAVMMQAMGFLEYNISPDNLNNFWRSQTLHNHYDYLDRPLFIDSGGFVLMNSETFGESPDYGGSENPWGIYTNPESILDLQLDFGADIIATLDFPIPQNLKEDEKVERMERSIDSAVQCLELLDERDANPAVYIAIHGHDYEMINWYVGQFLETAESYEDQFEGFAVGSLVPLRSSNRIDMLVDIVQGAKDAIPAERKDEIALHVFGISGKMVPLLTILGVDSFDSTTYQRTAQFKKFIHPESWEKVEAKNISEDWPCDCKACRQTDMTTLKRVLYADTSYSKVDGEYFKSEFYAKIAQHNFEIYQRQVQESHVAIEEDRLLEHVAEFGLKHESVAEGLKHAQLRDSDLRDELKSEGYEALLAGPETGTFQSRLTAFWDGEQPEERLQRTISLKHGPSDFNVLHMDYSPPVNKDILLILPCSQQKPYRESRTQQAVLRELGAFHEDIHKVTVSGLYGPVPEDYEEVKQVLEYEYVLTTDDTEQVELVTSRLHEFLEKYGDGFDEIVGYTTSKAYREVIETAFKRYGRGNVYPANPQALQLTEHFREANIHELLNHIRSQI